ncbi:MAG: RdgB/HAM1 family non-canonical purine NTP pyrophosphatase [Gammaproteobacteria bacterium]|nr:RdgB/HAM1 family non-canonical purine NTP pyrophosphatase [Gammaproteobacteria bacterium]
MTIIIASDNVKKVQELQSILGESNISTVLQSQFNIASVAETGLTFVENAILKARNASEHSKIPAIADDSGLEVDALSRRPGIYSARFAGPNAKDSDNIAKLLLELREIPEIERTARFQCVMVFLRDKDDPTPIICQGTWKGRITLASDGENGFGYDPIFWVPDYNCTAAQLSSEEKNKISHRAQALRALVIALKKEFNL